MDSLANYGSDDDYDDSPKHRKSASSYGSAYQSRTTTSQVDANYEEVQMDLSEDSNDSSPKYEDRQTNDQSSRDKSNSKQRYNDYSKRDDHNDREKDDYYKSSRDRMKRRDVREDSSRSSRGEDSNRSSRGEDFNRREDSSRSSREESGRSSREESSRNRESPSQRQHNNGREDEKYRNRDRDNRDNRYNRDDKHKDRYSRDKYNDRKRRSSSRERRRRSRSRSRSRSASRERTKGPNYPKRYDRASNKMAQLEKMGIEFKNQDGQFTNSSDQHRLGDDKKNSQDKDRFFMPGITGRFRDQIERRKLLWQKKEPERIETKTTAAPAMLPGTSSRVGKLWETTTFAQDSDGKVANKFKRLMGIREQPAETTKPTTTDILKKQEEMFSSMEAQYEVARTATHTMRGVGLGFGSFQR